MTRKITADTARTEFGQIMIAEISLARRERNERQQ
jgi:hypothetical protein